MRQSQNCFINYGASGNGYYMVRSAKRAESDGCRLLNRKKYPGRPSAEAVLGYLWKILGGGG